VDRRAIVVLGQPKIGLKCSALGGSQPDGLVLGFLKPDEPSDAIAIHYLTIRGAPRANLQLFTNRSSLGQGAEPGAQFGGGGRAEKREHETGTSERLLATSGIGSKKGHRPAEDAVGDGVGGAVVAPELSEGVQNELPAEDLLVEGQGLAGGAREV